jgi:hypothetical protein
MHTYATQSRACGFLIFFEKPFVIFVPSFVQACCSKSPGGEKEIAFPLSVIQFS